MYDILIFLNTYSKNISLYYESSKIWNDEKNYDILSIPVMIPVSSTVIPLPVYKMEYGFGFVSKNKKAQSSSKPEDGVKLITSKLNI